MANNNRFSINSLAWDLTADGNTIGNDPPFPAKDDWESITVLAQEISDLDAAGGGTLDLNFRQFAPLAGPNGNQKEWSNSAALPLNLINDITFFNGMISGAAILENQTWSNSGGGIYSATYDHAAVGDGVNPQAYLIDPMATDVPLLATWPSAAGGPREKVPRSNGSHWFDIVGSPEGNNILTWNATNGDTVDVANDKIRGLVINDLTLRAQWDAEFTSVLSSDSVDVSDLYMIGYCSNAEIDVFRVVSWDNSTGTLLLTSDLTGASSTTYSSFFPGYFTCAFIGAKSWINAPGQYTPDFSNNQVHYRPVSGLSPQGVGLQAAQRLIRTNGGGIGKMTLQRMILTGAASLSSDSAAGGTGKIADVHNCTCHSFGAGLSDIRNLTDSTFDYWYSVAAGLNTTGTEDVFLERNRFGPACEQRSCVTVYGPDIGEFDDYLPMGHFYGRDNYFVMPFSTHGQGISVYKDSWQKATIEHNVFHNCARALAYQHQNGSWGYRGNMGTYRFQNNLVCITDPNFVPPTGQTGYAFNNTVDYFLYTDNPDNDPLQEVYILSNSLLYTQEVYDSVGDIGKSLQMSIENHRLGPHIANNVCVGMEGADPVLRKGPMLELQQRANNLQTLSAGLYPAAWASNDLPDLPNDTVFSHLAGPDSFEMAGIYATGATDGGPIGIRWASIPSVTELKNGLSPTWYLDHPAVAFPEPTAGQYVDTPLGDNRP
jgi:hypothetical protein